MDGPLFAGGRYFAYPGLFQPGDFLKLFPQPPAEFFITHRLVPDGLFSSHVDGKDMG